MDNYGFDLSTRFVNDDEFKIYTGIDLESELRDGDNPSNKVSAFLMRTAIRFETYIDCHYFRKMEEEFPKFTDYQKLHYKIALLEQVLYVFKNGDIISDSGYDVEEGKTESDDYLDRIGIGRMARKNLEVCGLLSRKMRW